MYETHFVRPLFVKMVLFKGDENLLILHLSHGKMGVEGFIGPEVFFSFSRKLYMWGHLHQQRLLEADAVVGKTWIWWFTILTWNCWSTIQLIGFGGPAIYYRILFGNHLLDLQLTIQVRGWDNLAYWFATSIRKEESAESGKNGEERRECSVLTFMN